MMLSGKQNKKKIINDPVHGFISIPSNTAYDLIEHPYFQRLSRIKQLGLTSMVYPGAQHTRFQHALGAMHLMQSAVETLKNKGHNISDEEAEAVQVAILLHDIGHAPFSHVMENTLIEDMSHEHISLLMMQKLNEEFNNKLTLAIQIFQNKYKKQFLHQLVSSQLDMDRLDYLKRDSFFSGVSEGVIGSDRIIKMLNVKEDQLVVESKGIYSIEKFLIARRLMYWQVYLHKTALVAEIMLVNLFKRVKELYSQGEKLFCSPQLDYFLKQNISKNDFESQPEALENYALLDDTDIYCALKVWSMHHDIVLGTLASNLLNRKLLHIEIQKSPFNKELTKSLREKLMQKLNIKDKHLANYFIFTDKISNNAYSVKDDKINILYSNGIIKDISDASDILNLSVLSKTVKKHILCYPKYITQSN